MIPRSIPNTEYHWPPAIPIPNTDTEYSSGERARCDWCIAVGVGEANLEPRQLLSAVAAQPLSRGGGRR